MEIRSINSGVQYRVLKREINEKSDNLYGFNYLLGTVITSSENLKTFMPVKATFSALKY